MSSGTLKKKAIHGTIWTIVGHGASQSIRLGGNLILTRLLVPELFGLMALVHVFITGLELFSDIGIEPSIVRHQRGDDPVFLNTAWTIQVIRGFGIWLCCILIAFPVAQFYEDPRLLWLIPLVGFTSVIWGFTSTSLASFSRHMEIGKLTLFEMGTQIISLTVMLVWAWLSPTIWALIGGTFVSALSQLFWSHRLNSGKPNRFAWNKEIISEIATFGRWIFLSTAMTFLASQADRLILGKLFSFSMLGVYSVAFTFASLPEQVIQNVSNNVIFPVIAQYADLPRKSLRAKIIKKRKFILIGQALFLTLLVTFGDLLIIQLYDERFIQAAWMLPILALGLWPVMLSVTIDRALLVIGNPSYLAFGHIVKFTYMLIGLPLAFSQIGVLGTLIVIALNDLPFYAVVSYGLWREKLTVILQDLQATLLLIGLLTLFLTGRYWLGFGLPIDGIL
ncbi:oligosaccharide flippase family protein [Pleurocapsa sp. PCC 7319]|uniref:oligosaccharide flippase family protein n=1 Tax=Pleurocapsa sp. PCC 7319 TaxID=118161 RepID=UPI00034A6D55|nr:oligosaccharide flippase family protein [Pleurocapsa sp. PCC 7319]